MKERPILFSAPMVNVILSGKKTQTRRTIKPQPEDWTIPNDPGMSALWPAVNMRGKRAAKACPYGIPGDRLWVRETWMHGGYAAPGYARKYRADGLEVGGLGDFEEEPWRPSIFMPRWASRITLEVAEIRVQRLQDISEADAKAEGVEPATLYLSNECGPYVASYSTLWEKINGKGSWAANPWIWCVSFRRI